MMLQSLRLAGVVLALSATAASAATHFVTISGSGVWGASAPTNEVSAPSTAFSFSFTLPNPVASNPTSQATNFSYSLGGSTVSDPLTAVQFYPNYEFGLFDLKLNSGVIVSLFGADIGSTKTITPGVYAFTASPTPQIFDYGSGSVTVAASAPEPGSWALMFLGVSALGAGLRTRRRIAAAAI